MSSIFAAMSEKDNYRIMGIGLKKKEKNLHAKSNTLRVFERYLYKTEW